MGIGTGDTCAYPHKLFELDFLDSVDTYKAHMMDSGLIKMA